MCPRMLASLISHFSLLSAQVNGIRKTNLWRFWKIENWRSRSRRVERSLQDDAVPLLHTDRCACCSLLRVSSSESAVALQLLLMTPFVFVSRHVYLWQTLSLRTWRARAAPVRADRQQYIRHRQVQDSSLQILQRRSVQLTCSFSKSSWVMLQKANVHMARAADFCIRRSVSNLGRTCISLHRTMTAVHTSLQ